jgi:hypothetical protein
MGDLGGKALFVRGNGERACSRYPEPGGRLPREQPQPGYH